MKPRGSVIWNGKWKISFERIVFYTEQGSLKKRANDNRYTFVWRGTINSHMAGLLDTIDVLYARYNAFLSKNGYD